jgi:hypothetical protein
MPNGKHGDNPLSDFIVHGRSCFPADIEDLLRRIDQAGAAIGRWPLGENWPYSPREWDWAEGRELGAARRDLQSLLTMLETGRGDEILVNPGTGKPFAPPTATR